MRSYEWQKACIRDVLALARNEDILAGLEDAIATIEQIQNRNRALQTLAECATVYGQIQCEGYIGADNDHYE